MPYVTLRLTMDDFAWLIAGGQLTLGGHSAIVMYGQRDGAAVMKEAIEKAKSLNIREERPGKPPELW